VQITIETPDQCYYQARPGSRVCWRIDALIRESQGARFCTATPSGGHTAARVTSLHRRAQVWKAAERPPQLERAMKEVCISVRRRPNWGERGSRLSQFTAQVEDCGSTNASTLSRVRVKSANMGLLTVPQHSAAKPPDTSR